MNNINALSIIKQSRESALPLFKGSFQSMASECEVLVETESALIAEQMIQAVFLEAKRIEFKFSRYRSDSIISKINQSAGKRIKLDPETASLLDFAMLCHDMSDGLFDITAGILRKIWTFDGSDKVPSRNKIKKLLPLIGSEKLNWQSPYLKLQAGMELDFGGIGKEYAVDSALKKALEISQSPSILINFGGDLACNKSQSSNQAWQVGVERSGMAKNVSISLKQGALATSGDANRYLLKDNVRYSHILNPKMGCSIISAPRSITVAASSCVEAGLLSTIAMLQGSEAKAFLAEQDIPFWIEV